MYESKMAQDIWEKFCETFSMIDENREITFENILFNTVVKSKKRTIINLLVLITKQIIFRSKCQVKYVHWNQILAEYKLHYRIEMYNAVKIDKVEKISKKWSPVKNVILKDQENL